MFSRVLVANRGEIALRIYRACRELGVEAIGVYSEADRDGPWLRHADEAHLLGPAEPAASYLAVDRLLEVARATGADAVHPGYGFLSENAEFARRVLDADLAWIGPPPAAMDRMGDKLAARASAVAAGCPVVPGTAEPTDDAEVVRAFATEHGFPVLVKAAHGGGGRGQKVVTGAEDLGDVLEAASREAAAAFGRGEVYVERYLPRPRHIEVQVLADTHGRVLHLAERDCSTQRRHQKLIEEAPAPGLDDGLRAAMGEAAVRIARQVGYVGAGTCEFLCADGDFYFLEMNTRLQVEHPVTELVTGVDLVHWQLRVAAGESLPWAQDDVHVRGHAIEARINAENATLGFVPSPGLITEWAAPAGPGIRLDAAGGAGWTIPNHYDSLIAKLVAYGADREEARRRLLRACDEFVIGGVPTTLDFHRLALAHPDFVAGRVSTVSVEQEWDLSALPSPPPPTTGPAPRRGRNVVVEIGGKRVEVTVYDDEDAARPDGRRPPPRRRSAGRAGTAGGAGTVVAPMQGTIVKVPVEPGRHVATGDVLVVLEAMKMENAIAAEVDGVVTAVHVAQGDVVSAGGAMLELGPPVHDDPGEPGRPGSQ
jgi:acetyl-CoA/propionyl-CoA carboxylase, biotin carboxylase, biotin carboxyl carrier protein